MNGKVAKRLRAFAYAFRTFRTTDGRRYVARSMLRRVTQLDNKGVPQTVTVKRWNIRLAPDCVRAVYQKLKAEYKRESHS